MSSFSAILDSPLYLKSMEIRDIWYFWINTMRLNLRRILFKLLYLLTCVLDEVRVVSSAVDPLPLPLLPLLLQQSVLGIWRSHELGLLSAGLGAPSSEDQSDEDDHQDQDGDDGQEYPDEGGDTESLSDVVEHYISCLSVSHCFKENWMESFIFCYRVWVESLLVFCLNCISNEKIPTPHLPLSRSPGCPAHC